MGRLARQCDGPEPRSNPSFSPSSRRGGQRRCPSIRCFSVWNHVRYDRIGRPTRQGSGPGESYVADDTSHELQILIDRLRRGDETARRELLRRAHDRLLKIAATIFRGISRPCTAATTWRASSARSGCGWPPPWRRPGRRPSRASSGWSSSRCARSCSTWRAPAPAMRSEGRRRPRGRVGRHGRLRPADTTHDPPRLALLTEFHEQIEKLPEDQRRVFELHYYGDFSQAEIGQMLGLHKKQVSRLWLRRYGEAGAAGWRGSNAADRRRRAGVDDRRAQAMHDHDAESQGATRRKAERDAEDRLEPAGPARPGGRPAPRPPGTMGGPLPRRRGRAAPDRSASTTPT